jgi:hypothetical protein
MNPIARIDVTPVEGEERVYVARRDWIADWSGDFICFGFGNGKVDWWATVSEPPQEQSILDVRGFRLSGHTSSFVEVFGITHMGNGCYYLYELKERALRLVLRTLAVDQHRDTNLIRGPRLTVIYRDLNGDGFADVELSGVVEEYTDDSEDPIRSYPCRKAFLWQPRSHCFVEDRSQRSGFETYPDEQTPSQEDLTAFRYSGTPIHPLCVKALLGHLADPLPWIASVELEASSKSNECRSIPCTEERGAVRCNAVDSGSPASFFQYKHLGMTSDGTHILVTADCGGGSGVFEDLLFVRFEPDRAYEQGTYRDRMLMRCIGSFVLGDRDDGQVELIGDRIRVGASRCRPKEIVLTPTKPR